VEGSWIPFLGTITYPGSLSNSTLLDGGFEYCKFSPPGEMIQFDEHIVQRGWFNHQLVLKMMISPTFPASEFVAETPPDADFGGHDRLFL